MRYGIPPNGGGQRDQPAGWFERAETLHRVYQAFGAYARREIGKESAWRKGNPEEWRIVRQVQELMTDG